MTRELLRNGLDAVLFEAGPSVGGMADSHHDAEGFTFDTGAHFITNRLATATGINDRCRDVERYGETVWIHGLSYDYPAGLLKVPRYVRLGVGGTGPAPNGTGHVSGRSVPSRLRHRTRGRDRPAPPRGVVGRRPRRSSPLRSPTRSPSGIAEPSASRSRPA